MKAKRPPEGKSYTLTLAQCTELFRSVGIKMDNKRLADGIRAGIYPGRVISVGPTGRTTFEIWRKDMEAFLRDRCPDPIKN